jgi:hypothetical protein
VISLSVVVKGVVEVPVEVPVSEVEVAVSVVLVSVPVVDVAVVLISQFGPLNPVASQSHPQYEALAPP